MIDEEFLGFINDNRLFEPTDRVLLAVSGGVDSVAMTDLFYRVGQPFAIAHVNFSMRGAESDADAVFVENMAIRYGVPFHTIRFDTTAFAQLHGLSIQMAARQLRYNWFEELLQKHAYACVATAHHQNDQLETLLLNLTRGTGIAGLHGISPRQNKLVRPLLCATRDQVMAYVNDQSLDYREDSSNADDKYARNRIRHHVVPVLNELNPGLWQTMSRTIERFGAAEILMRAELDRSWHTVAEPRGKGVVLAIEKLRQMPAIAFRLAEWLAPVGFTADQAHQLANSLSRPAGQIIQSATHRVVHERFGLLLEPLPEKIDCHLILDDWPKTPLTIAGLFTLTIERIDKPLDFTPPKDSTLAFIDVDQLTFPLTIRTWKQGDKLRPLGLNGHKLVSDLLNDLKLSRTEREQTLVLLADNEIVWVIGHRIDHRFRVTAQSRQLVRMELSYR